MQGGPGHGQEGRGAGQALRGRDSAPGAVATRAAALRKEPVGAKYMLTAPAPLMAPPGSRNAARCPPPRATSHCCRVQRCCQHGHSPPPRMLHQHPRVSRMAGPQGPGAGDPRDTAPRIPVPSPAAAVGHSLSGWTSTPVPPKKQTVRVSRGQRLQRCTHLTLRAPLALQHSGLLPHSFAVGVQGTPGTGEAVGAQWELKAGGCAHPEPPEPGHRVGALVPQPSSAPAASADLGQPPRTAVLGVAQPGGVGGAHTAPSDGTVPAALGRALPVTLEGQAPQDARRSRGASSPPTLALATPGRSHHPTLPLPCPMARLCAQIFQVISAKPLCSPEGAPTAAGSPQPQHCP